MEKLEEDKIELKIPALSYALHLTWDFNVICNMEEESGCHLLNPITSVLRCSARQLRAFLCAALRPAHPKTTLEDAGTALTSDMSACLIALQRMLILAGVMQAPEEEDGGDGDGAIVAEAETQQPA